MAEGYSTYVDSYLLDLLYLVTDHNSIHHSVHTNSKAMFTEAMPFILSYCMLCVVYDWFFFLNYIFVN